jgi:hypothetical protein
LAFIAAAAAKMIYVKIPIFDWGYAYLALTSWSFVLLAGAAFIAALITMVVAGARSAGVGKPPIPPDAKTELSTKPGQV